MQRNNSVSPNYWRYIYINTTQVLITISNYTQLFFRGKQVNVLISVNMFLRNFCTRYAIRSRKFFCCFLYIKCKQIDQWNEITNFLEQREMYFKMFQNYQRKKGIKIGVFSNGFQTYIRMWNKNTTLYLIIH